MIIYQSKKDETVKAKLLSQDEKYGTSLLEYTEGKDAGKTVSITNSTLKRWWKKVEEDKKVEGALKIDYEKVNTKYPEPVEQKYIPKPQSVIEYEEKRRKKYNNELPTQDEMVEHFSSLLSKINKTYIVFGKGFGVGCWLERKSGYTNLYATESVWMCLTENFGFEGRKNGMKNTKLPVVFKIETLEQYEVIKEVFTND